MRTLIKRLAILFIILMPIYIVYFAKPLRLLLPAINDVYCSGNICVEERAQLKNAQNLYHSAVKGLSRLGLSATSKAVFVYCSTPGCYSSFGGGNEGAISFPYLGTIIGPDSWQVYISKHELIHWLQFKHYGAVGTMRKPKWFREGMAYSLSQPPQDDIPQHYLPLIKRYEIWQGDKSGGEVFHSSETSF